MLTVSAFYQFARFPDPGGLRAPLLSACRHAGLTGTILLAPEGINGTVAGPADGVAAVLAHVRALPGCATLDSKESRAASQPFNRMKVRLKREIVTMGQPDVDPQASVGHYVNAPDWNALITAPDVVVIDTRNDYEVAIGSFANAVNPETKVFGDFPAWWEAQAHRFQGKRVAMFCTGGIRCEKSTNYLMSQGVEDVFHLKGGILKYLETILPEDSLWQGECFVFDGRVSVGHGLAQGLHSLCHACRRPLDPKDRSDPAFEEGVACPSCVSKTSDADKARFRERQKQIALAAARGSRHLGTI
jgi:UPF0176 protein